MSGHSGAITLIMTPDPLWSSTQQVSSQSHAGPLLTRAECEGGTVASQRVGLGIGPAALNPPDFSHLRAFARAAPYT